MLRGEQRQGQDRSEHQVDHEECEELCTGLPAGLLADGCDLEARVEHPEARPGSPHLCDSEAIRQPAPVRPGAPTHPTAFDRWSACASMAQCLMLRQEFD